MSSSFRRKVGALLIAAVLLAPWVASAEPGAWKDPAATRVPWDLLDRLWTPVTALWSEAGCMIDPYGLYGAANSTPVPTENLDNGCKIDPYGACRSGS
jgi:hypothetical protein